MRPNRLAEHSQRYGLHDLDRGCRAVTHAGLPTDALCIGSQQCGQPTIGFQQLLCERLGIAARDGEGKQIFDQLMVQQGLTALFEQPLPQSGTMTDAVVPLAICQDSLPPFRVTFRHFCRLIKPLCQKRIATIGALPHLTPMADDAPNEVEEQSIAEPLRRGRLARRVFTGAGLTLVALLAVAWWQREGIARGFVEDQLEANNIRASYEIDEIGFRTQRLRNVVIGDPKNPDLTAKLIEIDVALNFSGAELRDVRARGVRLRGRYAGGKLSFGELDKLQDPTSKEPFDWPDIGLDLRDARGRIDTPWGVVGLGLEGEGLLRNRFDGRLAVRAPNMAFDGSCRITDLRYDGKLLLEWRQPHFVGPLTARKADCGPAGFSAVAPALFADLKLGTQFDRWVGDIGFAAGDARYGKTRFSNSRGVVSIDGSLQRTNYTLALDRMGLDAEGGAITQLALDATGNAGLVDGRPSLSARGGAHFNGGMIDQSKFAGLDGLVSQTRGTPVGPLMAKLVPAIKRAGDRFSGQVGYDGLYRADGSSEIVVDGLALDSSSGAHIRQSGPLAISQRGSNWALANALGLAIRGADLPAAQISLTQTPSGNWGGNISIDNYAAQGASLAVPKLTFLGRPGGTWTFDGNAKLSGPIADGAVTGLQLPLDGRYGNGVLTAFQGCRNFRFDSLRVSTLSLAGNSLRLCPEEWGSILSVGQGGTRFAANANNVALNGRMGSSPAALRSAQVRFNLASGFTANDVHVEIGENSAPTIFDMAQLSGRFANGGLAGTLAGGAGRIGNIPLLMSEAAGDWHYNQGILNIDGDMRVADAQSAERFRPMHVPDMLLTLQNGVITAIGHVHEPTTGTRVADVDIRHTLDGGTGRALLAVDDLTFTERFQPELLTPLVLGVVANVIGKVSGDGQIEWDVAGVRSTGRFGTKNIDLAAAFGPVEGINGEIAFSDLLGLETTDGQSLFIRSVNPGIAAGNGTIRYQLLSGQRIRIEGGRWPFAGGELILEPTTLDMGVESERRLTFRVIGMDAAKFLEPYGLSNLQVTGIFDGTLPMIFDQDGGRIVGGALVSRPGGGEISYLGELTYENLGTMANFAFDALKSIRYSTMEMGIGGNIAGEIVTDVSFTGVQQGSLAKRNIITKQLAKIPIQFNVSIKAQFLQLISSIRGLYDAQYAADQVLPSILGREGVPVDPPITGEEKPQEPAKKEDEPDGE